MAKNRIAVQTSKGRPVYPFKTKPGVPLGIFDPETGRVYQKPRAKLDYLTGGNVRVTNPAALASKRAERTASLGMRGVGSRGRTFDNGAPSES